MKPLFPFLFLTLFSFNLIGQIPNGGFEDWEIDVDGNELPLFWKPLNPFFNQFIFKSPNSYTGDYALGIETVQDPEEVYGPVQIRSELIPVSLSNILSVHYKIDSIAGDGKISLAVFSKNIAGEESFVDYTIFNETNSDYEKVNFPFVLESLDTIVIYLSTDNEQTDIGWTGYTRALFDEVELTPITSTISVQDSDPLKICPNPTNGFFKIRNLQSNHKFLKIFSTLGDMIHEQIVTGDPIYLEEKGMFFIVVYDGEGRAMEIVKLINFN